MGTSASGESLKRRPRPWFWRAPGVFADDDADAGEDLLEDGGDPEAVVVSGGGRAAVAAHEEDGVILEGEAEVFAEVRDWGRRVMQGDAGRDVGELFRCDSDVGQGATDPKRHGDPRDGRRG